MWPQIVILFSMTLGAAMHTLEFYYTGQTKLFIARCMIAAFYFFVFYAGGFFNILLR